MTDMDQDTPLLSCDELERRLADPSLRLYDVTVDMQIKPGGGYEIASGREKYADGHIPGAAFLDLLDDFSADNPPLVFTLPTAAAFARAAGAAGISAQSQVVLYNAGPTWWATRMWFMLREFGFDAACVLDGGLDAWRAADKPLETGVRSYPPASFPAGRRRKVFVDKADVKAAVDADSAALVNALSPAVFAGTAGTYMRPGRIPGSCNVYAMDLVDPASKRFLARNELRAKLGAAGLLTDKPVIAYCGGGISATTNAFALHLLGRDDVQIYDGSLSEWARDPAMPMETGD
ncbi:MAG TPA: rhodanese-like domain-containing protein [Steroidobacteraceae bacterium]|nr:rhodanese-like domain-containing protein [Steroidobacteraceae bacterium]HRX89010.1 rhodanese-like domain-containing protein [Steroidobacteraceae bacterium]